jgi:hypothetical protein
MVDQTITKLVKFIKESQHPNPWDSIHCNLHGNEEQCFGFQLISHGNVQQSKTNFFDNTPLSIV